MNEITLCIIARDEADSIAECIGSAASAVDDVIVGIDSRTKDGTATAVRNTGSRSFMFKWDSDFSAARNKVLNRVYTPWVLFLDADERLTRAGGSTIARAIKSAPEMDAFQLAMEHLTLDGKTIARDYHTRLFKKHLRYQFPVHEEVRGNTLCQIQATEAHIIHYGYDPLVYRERAKLLRNLDMLTDWVKRDPYAAQPNYYLAKIMFERQRNSAASTYAAIALKRADELSSDQANLLRTLMAEYKDPLPISDPEG